MYVTSSNKPQSGSGPNVVLIFSDTCTLVGHVTLPTNGDPRGIAYDPADNEVYLADNALGQIYVISGSSLVDTIRHAGFDEPYGVVYDGALSGVAVTIQIPGNVALIVGTQVVAFVSAHEPNPEGIAYSPTGSALVVTSFGYSTGTVAILSATTGAFLRHIFINLGSSTAEAAYDPLDHRTYVADWSRNSIDAVSLTDGKVTKRIGLGFGFAPWGVAYSGEEGAIYVGSHSSDKIVVVKYLRIIATIDVTGDSGSQGLAYDAANTDLYVTTGVIGIFAIPT
jgi:DNA-binding beta-propeller fold protein YncE